MAHLIPIRGFPLHQRLHLSSFPLVVGRGTEVGLQIDARGVSRQHAEFMLDDAGEVVVRDLGSRNGTRVNGESVAERGLAAGDVIKFGKAEFRFELDEVETGELQSSPPETARLTQNVMQHVAEVSSSPFDTQALARRLVRWAQEWGPCAVEFRFRHGSQSHSCWVATDVGKIVLSEFFQRLEQVADARQVNPSVTEVLFSRARTGSLQEDEAWGWINGTAASYNVAPTAAWTTWSNVEEQAGWWSTTAPPWAGPTRVPELEDARHLHGMSLGPGRSYLYVAIPERAIRTSGTIGDIVVLHALWAQEGTYVYESAARDVTKVEFQRRVRDAATQFLIWTSVRFLNREARARSVWQQASERAEALFNEDGGAPHDPHRWTQEDLAEHFPTLDQICGELASAVEELGGSLGWPRSEPIPEAPEGCWQLMVAKALSHGAVHPLVVASLFEEQGAPAVASARATRSAIVARGGEEARSDLSLVEAFIHLRQAEGPNLSGVGFVQEGPHLLFVADLEVQRSRESLAASVLFRELDGQAGGGKTTAAFAALRRLAASVSVESAPADLGRSLTVVLRFDFESYAPLSPHERD